MLDIVDSSAVRTRCGFGSPLETVRIHTPAANDIPLPVFALVFATMGKNPPSGNEKRQKRPSNREKDQLYKGELNHV